MIGMQDEIEKIVFNVIEMLKAERLGQSLSHEKLSQKANIHRTSIGHIEAHQMVPTLTMCLKISRALQIDFDVLLRNAFRAAVDTHSNFDDTN